MKKYLFRNKTIGLIGFGKFGKVICDFLFPNQKLLIYSPHAQNKTLPERALLKENIRELVVESDIILPAVPIREFENVIRIIAPFIKPQTLIIDVCSVKAYSVMIMKEILPKDAQIIASHPMFGPNSLKQRNNNIKHLKIVLYNVNSISDIYNSCKKYFADLGLDVIEMEPDEHDNLSAHSQFFAMLTGAFAKNLNIKPTSIDTPSAQAINKALAYMGNNTETIKDMIKYNSYCTNVLTELSKQIINLIN